MDDYDDLDANNGDAVHDMWFDFSNYENTSAPGVCDEDNLDEYIDELNDWD